MSVKRLSRCFISVIRIPSTCLHGERPHINIILSFNVLAEWEGCTERHYAVEKRFCRCSLKVRAARMKTRRDIVKLGAETTRLLVWSLGYFGWHLAVVTAFHFASPLSAIKFLPVTGWQPLPKALGLHLSLQLITFFFDAGSVLVSTPYTVSKDLKGKGFFQVKLQN